ncbi:MAG: hypothetical protein BWX81_00108 [Spirochaetes bacterium ADurb.Bin110]|nr:MAG: hypothetical protein BWX81_00259 [Spirochaetes bacterium ADurb.Bin110]OQB98924.1 MAG: hypothetical protein BWX81_00108 [Spirochaetes bacterium ADurb.Bin110]
MMKRMPNATTIVMIIDAFFILKPPEKKESELNSL